MRQGEILAAGFPGFLGSGVLQPPAGGDQYQIVLRFDDEASRIAGNVLPPRRMWLERGAALVRGSEVRRARGMDGWFGQGPRAAALEAGGQHLAGLLPAAADVLGAAGRTAGGPADVLARC